MSPIVEHHEDLGSIIDAPLVRLSIQCRRTVAPSTSAGEVDMHFKQDGLETCVRLKTSDIFLADLGDEHVAHPVGEARILVVERKGSV